MKVCIATMVSGEYQWYAPLFVHRCRRIYPKYDVRVLCRNMSSLPFELSPGVNSGEYNMGMYRDYPINGPTTACLRFVEGEDDLKEFDCVLLTDVDIMMGREDPDFVEQRLSFMEKHGLEHYSNYTIGNRMLGVHFVTNTWWPITMLARDRYRRYLRDNRVAKNFDEIMLKKIVEESGLKTVEEASAGKEHGLHLGKYRKLPKTLPNAKEQAIIEELFDDPDFMKKAEICAENNEEIAKIMDNLDIALRGDVNAR